MDNRLKRDYVPDFSGKEDSEWRAITVDGEGIPEVIQYFNPSKNRWLNTEINPEKIPEDAFYKEEEIVSFKYKELTGETIEEVWDYFRDALTKQMEENPETGEIKTTGSIDSAVILCSLDLDYSTLPAYFQSILDGIEISYQGLAKQAKNKNLSLQALNFADELEILPVINSEAHQLELLGMADKVCNNFSIRINSEPALIKAILEGKVTDKHWDSVEKFSKTAKKITVDANGLAKNILAENELGIIWKTGRGDEY